jgi:DNA replication licensing factor MCM7
MDDVGNASGRGRGAAAAAQRSSKVKYMKLLQDVADRKTAQIVIEMDDLEEVRDQLISCLGHGINSVN